MPRRSNLPILAGRAMLLAGFAMLLAGCSDDHGHPAACPRARIIWPFTFFPADVGEAPHEVFVSLEVPLSGTPEMNGDEMKLVEASRGCELDETVTADRINRFNAQKDVLRVFDWQNPCDYFVHDDYPANSMDADLPLHEAFRRDHGDAVVAACLTSNSPSSADVIGATRSGSNTVTCTVSFHARYTDQVARAFELCGSMHVVADVARYQKKYPHFEPLPEYKGTTEH